MKFVESKSYVEDTWITMSDGVRLAARIWRPKASDEPVPAILELIPYRLRDITAHRDSRNHQYIASHGFACVRVDIRGSGESDGVLTGEYLESELQDAEEILAWLAAQPWCSGKTGMMGYSWGGFNALQVAARRPPSLAAIITVNSTDDRYADDVHYMGGCLLVDNFNWATTMFAHNARPPDPAVVGERWRKMWLERLENSGHWLDPWLRHQRRDAYWKHGSVCENFGDIEVPVFAVSGWADGYSNAVPRLMNNLNVPRKGLIGPWAHGYPHTVVPGPAIGFLQEVVRWWDRWLKDIPNTVMDGPMLQMWMQDSAPPETSYAERSGRWVNADSVRTSQYRLAPGRIAQDNERVGDATLTISSPITVGQFGGKWCSYSVPADLPDDQQSEDAGSLVFDSDVLTEVFGIAGAPVVELDVSVDKAVAQLAVRLCDVAENGESTRVTYGVLNLTHRESHEHPSELVPGERYVVRVQLNDIAHSFSAGHKMRLAISTSYWPITWPSPEPVQLSVHCGNSKLSLPVYSSSEPDHVVEFGEPECVYDTPPATISAGENAWNVSDGLVEMVLDYGVVRFEDIDLTATRRFDEWYTHEDGSVRAEAKWNVEFARGDWITRMQTHTVLTSSATEFHMQAELRAYENDVELFSKTWDEQIPRDLV